MKRLCLMLLGMLFLYSGFSQHWIKQNSGTTNTLKSIYFADSNTGYVVGSAGTILKTTNGGTDWIILNPGTVNSLNSVRFINSDTGYVAGDGGTILKTTNGGTNWIIQNTGTVNSLNSVRFIDMDTGYATGIGGTLLKTTDGGTNWTFQNSPGNGPISLIDSKIIYLLGDYFNIFKTTDGGVNWMIQNQNYNYGLLYDICFTDSITGIAVGGGFAQGLFYWAIYNTNNGGLTWNVIYHNNYTYLSGVYLYSVFLVNQLTAYSVGGKGTIIKTINGGNTWNDQISGTTETLNSVYFTDSITGYVVGDSGIILKTINGGVGIANLSRDDLAINIYPNPAVDRLTIDFNNRVPVQKKTSISMADSRGQILLRQEINQNRTELDISGFMPGVYILRINSPDKTAVYKLIKE